MRGFVFVHIPRTAGGTINHVLRRRFPKDVAVLIDTFVGERVKKTRVYYPSDYYVKSVEEVRHFPIITGHIPYYKVKHFKRPLATWLRHPVERVISHYNVALRRKDHKYSGIVDFAVKTRNLMTFFTDGSLDVFDFVGITENFDRDIQMMFDAFDLGKVEYNKVHVNQFKIDIDDKTRNLIMELNEKDMRLYERVK